MTNFIKILFSFFLVLSINTQLLAQEEESTVFVEKIVLKNGQQLSLYENQKLFVVYGPDFTNLEVETKGAKKTTTYEAKDIDTLIFRNDVKTDTCWSFQIGKNKHALLIVLYAGDLATVYRTPHFGKGGFYYLIKSGDEMIELISATQIAFNKYLSNCDAFNAECKKHKSEIKKGVLTEEEAIDILQKYNEFCQ